MGHLCPQGDKRITDGTGAARLEVVPVALLQLDGTMTFRQALPPVRLEGIGKDGLARLVLLVLGVMPASLGVTQVVPIRRSIAGPRKRGRIDECFDQHRSIPMAGAFPISRSSV